MKKMKRSVVLSGISLLLLSACASEDSNSTSAPMPTDDAYESITGTANPYMGMSEEELSSAAAGAGAANQAAVSSIMAEPIPGAGPQPEMCKQLGDDFLADEGYITFEGAWFTTPELGDEACSYTKLEGQDTHGLNIMEMSPSEDLPESVRMYHEQQDVTVEASVPGAFITRFVSWDDSIYSCAAAVVQGDREYHADLSVTRGNGGTGDWRELCPEAMRLLGRAMEKLG